MDIEQYSGSEKEKEFNLRSSLRGKRDDTILKLPSSKFMIEPYVNMFRRNFKKNLSEKNKSIIKEVISRLKKFSSSEIDDALKRNNAGTYDNYKELKKNYKEHTKKTEAVEETKKVPEKVSRAGQKPPPGSKISPELLKQLRGVKNFKELTKKALQKLKEDRFAKAREEIEKMRRKKPIIKQSDMNIAEPEIIEDINNEIKMFDNNKNKMEEKKPKEKKKVVITRKKKVKSAEEDNGIDDILNKMLSDFSNLKKEFEPLSIKLERKEPEIPLVKEKTLLDEIEEAEKEIKRVAEVAIYKLEKEKTKILDKQDKRDVKQDKSEFKKEFTQRFSKYMGKKKEFWESHTEQEAEKLGKKWAKAFNI